MSVLLCGNLFIVGIDITKFKERFEQQNKEEEQLVFKMAKDQEIRALVLNEK